MATSDLMYYMISSTTTNVFTLNTTLHRVIVFVYFNLKGQHTCWRYRTWLKSYSLKAHSRKFLQRVILFDGYRWGYIPKSIYTYMCMCTFTLDTLTLLAVDWYKHMRYFQANIGCFRRIVLITQIHVYIILIMKIKLDL